MLDIDFLILTDFVALGSFLEVDFDLGAGSFSFLVDRAIAALKSSRRVLVLRLLFCLY